MPRSRRRLSFWTLESMYALRMLERLEIVPSDSEIALIALREFFKGVVADSCCTVVIGDDGREGS